MNDFTKEELEDLYIAMRIIDNLSYDLPSDKDPYVLKEKIQSMIDNYCEHDWRKGVHLFNDVYCTKCKLHFEVNNDGERSDSSNVNNR